MSAHQRLLVGTGLGVVHILLVTAVLTSPAVRGTLGADPDRGTAQRSWDFESDELDKVARGFTPEVGTWEVARDGDNRVLFQKARNEDNTFNIALVHGTSYLDVNLSVRLKAVAGDVDRGGGLVWRAKDKDNYYLCRYNPLEDNYRVYKVEKGKRTQFASVKVPGDEAWHTLRASMIGSKISCYLDGKKLLEAEDSTFPGPGMVGLWSKADAQSHFDDLTVAEGK
jgi:hypothetical protein